MFPIIGVALAGVVTMGGAQMARLHQPAQRPLMAEIIASQRKAAIRQQSAKSGRQLQFPVLLLAGGALLTSSGVARRQERSSSIELPQTEPAAKPAPVEAPAHSRLLNLGAGFQTVTQQWYTRGQSLVQAQGELLFGDQRRQQLQIFRTQSSPAPANPEAPMQSDELVTVEQEINQHLLVALTGTAIAATGLLTHLTLGPLSIPFTLYTCIPLVKVVYKGIAEEGRLRGPVVDLLAVGASLSAHYYLLTAASCTLMCAAEKIVYRTQDRSRRDMTTVFQQQQQLVWALRNGVEVETPLADLQVGDIVVVAAGGVIPVDGVITLGAATVDQHMLTGEAQPVEKGVGDAVLAATLVLTGHIHLRVEKTGNATITAQIGAVMNEIEDYRERQEMRCDETADRLVLPTLAAGALTLARLGGMSAVTVVGANFTETLRVAYPLGALSYLNRAAQQGILIKDGRALEMLSKVDTVIFDKTGTLTLEQPHVAALHPYASITEAQLLRYAAAAEFRQTHPIARAILAAAEQRQLILPPIEEAAYAVGYGIKVRVMRPEEQGTGGSGQGVCDNSAGRMPRSKLVRVGSARYMAQEGIELPAAIQILQQRCHEQGHSLVYVAVDEQLAGALELHATIRPEVTEVVQQLRQRQIKLYIISGDQPQPTQHLAASLGMDGYFAEVLPADKAKFVAQLQAAGARVCFIGDGINDAIALKQADVSISLRGATTVATDIAQIILMEQSLAQLDHLFDLAQQLDANLKRSFAAMIIPSCINLGGALFFGFTIRSAIVLFNMSLLAGIANSLSPLLTLKARDQSPVASSHSPLSTLHSPLSSLPSSIPIFPQFKRLELSDRAEIEQFARPFPPYSHFSFSSLFAYDIAENLQVAWLHGNLIVRALDFHTMRPYYSFLGDSQVTDTIQQLLAQAQQEGITSELLIVPEVCISPALAELSERFTISEDRACFDYILSVANLCALGADPDQPKARDLHKFTRKYPHAVTKQLDLCQLEIQSQVRTLFQTWADKRQKAADDTHIERTAFERIMQLALHMPLVTLGVYLDDQLVGFTINEVVQDGHYIGHFGKADPTYRGLSLYLERETAKVMAELGCLYMNYEEDLGAPGLRAYKASLQPIGYLKKYTISAR